MKIIQYKGREIKIRKIKGYWTAFVDGQKIGTDSCYFGNELTKAQRHIDRNGRPE